MLIGDKSSVRDQISCAGILHGLNLYRPFVCYHNLSEFIKSLILGVSPTPLAHKHFSASSSTKFPDPQWEGFAGNIGDILFRTGCSKVCRPVYCMIAFVYVIWFVIFVWSVFFVLYSYFFFFFAFFLFLRHRVRDRGRQREERRERIYIKPGGLGGEQDLGWIGG